MNVSTTYPPPLAPCRVRLLVDGVSEYHHGIIRNGFFQEFQKVWAENFTLARDPNSKSPNGLQVQMADSYDRGREEGRRRSVSRCECYSVCLSICL